MTVKHLQSSFNSGVLNPLLHARKDIRHYFQGAEDLTNCILLPEGGAKRRPGTIQVDDTYKTLTRNTGETPTAPEGGTAGNANDDNTTTEVVTTTGISTKNPYVVIRYDLGSAKAILFADVVGLRVTPAGSSTEFEIQYSFNDITWLTFDTALDTIGTTDYTARRTGPITAQYWRVARIGSTDLTTNNVAIDEFTLWAEDAAYGDAAFIDFAFSTTQTYLLVFTYRNIAVYRDNVLQVNIRSPFFATQLAAMDTTQSADTLIAVYEDIRPTRLTRTGHTVWQIDNAPLTNIPQFDFGSGAEDIWSTARGWPRTVTFHEARTIFGGSRDKPQTLVGSQTNDFFNFDEGTGLDDEAIVRTIDTDEVNAIQGIYSADNLVIFTTGAEFYMPDEPITPKASSIPRQSRFGSEQISPTNIDGATIFIQKDSNVIREFLFNFQTDKYLAITNSLLSSHLFNSPVDMAASVGAIENNANYLYVVNSDGTAPVYNSIREQEVAAWSGPWITDGNFLNVAVVKKDVYFLVKRTIDGSERRYIERVSNTVLTDSAFTTTYGSPQSVITGLDHLEGKTVRVKADGAVMADAVVAAGQITLVRDTTTIEVGLNYNPIIKTLRLSVDFQDGTILTDEKSVVRATLDLHNSLGVFVSSSAAAGGRIADLEFGEGVLDQVPVPFTGIKEMYLGGWDRLGQVTITQVDPVPLTVRGILTELEA